ncbi:MAG: hypothetical protein SW833_05170 [Cyanobacteriota bacterium]|nr:hypothetical protein [Cyanobacteriota bacterium]
MKIPLFVGLTLFALLFPQVAIAQKNPKFAACVLDTDLLDEQGQPTRPGLVTAYTYSQSEMTLPSLWWAQEQFGEGKLLVNWIAHLQEKRLDLIVNWQLWSVLSYVERYSFVHRFGTVARQYGYQLKVFDQRSECLALYTCNFDAAVSPCSIELDPTTRGRFRL